MQTLANQAPAPNNRYAAPGKQPLYINNLVPSVELQQNHLSPNVNEVYLSLNEQTRRKQMNHQLQKIEADHKGLSSHEVVGSLPHNYQPGQPLSKQTQQISNYQQIYLSQPNSRVFKQNKNILNAASKAPASVNQGDGGLANLRIQGNHNLQFLPPIQSTKNHNEANGPISKRGNAADRKLVGSHDFIGGGGANQANLTTNQAV